MSSNLQIGRGWPVFSADHKRVGDVTEVHPHFILVTRGVLLVKDMYLPLGAVERVEASTVVLSITYAALRKMDLAHEPPAPVEPPPDYSDTSPRSMTQGSLADYPSEASSSSEPLAFPGSWGEQEEYEETPSYNRPLPNGLVEVEHALNLAFSDLGYGMPAVLMQGWPFDSAIWEPMPYQLALYNRVVTFDMRGSGDSDKPWDFYSPQTFSQDLHRLVIEQSLHNVTLVAWSTAVQVALTYVQDHPKRVERLVLISPLIPAWLMAEDAKDWLREPAALDMPNFALWQSDLIYHRPELFGQILDRLTVSPLDASRRSWMFTRMMRGAQHAQIKSLEMFLIEDPAAMLDNIKTPITILHGLQDRIAPFALAERLAGLLPTATVVPLEDCGHAPFLDQAERLAKIIGDLVSPPPEPAYEEAGTIESDATNRQPADEDPEMVGSAPDNALLSGEPVSVLLDMEGQ